MIVDFFIPFSSLHRENNKQEEYLVPPFFSFLFKIKSNEIVHYYIVLRVFSHMRTQETDAFTFLFFYIHNNFIFYCNTTRYAQQKRYYAQRTIINDTKIQSECGDWNWMWVKPRAQRGLKRSDWIMRERSYEWRQKQNERMREMNVEGELYWRKWRESESELVC